MESIGQAATLVSVLLLFLVALCRTPGVDVVHVLDVLGRLLPFLLRPAGSGADEPQESSGAS
jgi:hypothetical protein